MVFKPLMEGVPGEENLAIRNYAWRHLMKANSKI